MPWRKLAELLASHPEAVEAKLQLVPLPELPTEEPTRRERIKRKMARPLVIFVCILVVVFFAAVGVRRYLSTRTAKSYTLITGITFQDLWYEDKEFFATLCSDQEAGIGFDKYFFQPRTLKIAPEYYSVIVKGYSYLSVNVEIEIPYEEAEELNLLEDDFIRVEAVFSNAEFIRDYCTVVRISTGIQ